MAGESRTELINWLNETLQLDYKKVEQCGNGAVYCQLLDSIYHDIPMSRVNFDAKSEFDCSTNMKILQASFQKHKITRIIDVERIMKCRLQDNLELLQWFKKYWMEKKDFNVEYDAIGRRKKGLKNGGGTGSAGGSISASGGGSGGTRPASSSGVRSVSGGINGNSKRVVSNGGNTSSLRTSTPRSRVSSTSSSTPASAPSISAGKAPVSTAKQPISSAKMAQISKELAEAKAHIETLTANLNQITMEHDALQAERNFFYQKLVDIEILVDTTKEPLEKEDPVYELAEKVSEILVATEEGFSSNQDDMDVEKFNIEAESF